MCDSASAAPLVVSEARVLASASASVAQSSGRRRVVTGE